MSVRPSIASPLICSGAMYCGVPSMSPAWVIASWDCRESSRSFAMPKSSTRAMSRWRPRSCSITLSGLRSRWTRPWACASISEAQICPRIASERPIPSGASAWTTLRSDAPAMSSIEMNSVPSVSWPKS